MPAARTRSNGVVVLSALLLLFAVAAPGAAFGAPGVSEDAWRAPSFDSSDAVAATPDDAFALPSPWVGTEPAALAAAAAPPAHEDHEPAVFGGERARILLRSLTVPGWGQYSLGHHTAAGIFALAETGIWISFASFRIQEQLRREAYERTARLLAGIDLRGRDEEFRRVVGSYLSSDQYNQYVVFRDAVAIYPDDPAKYRAYIAEHSIGGADAWHWDSPESLLRYRSERRAVDRAALRSNTALALAVINRIISAAHAARMSGHELSTREDPPRPSFSLEISPFDGFDARAIRVGVRARY